MKRIIAGMMVVALLLSFSTVAMAQNTEGLRTGGKIVKVKSGYAIENQFGQVALSAASGKALAKFAGKYVQVEVKDFKNSVVTAGKVTELKLLKFTTLIQPLDSTYGMVLGVKNGKNYYQIHAWSEAVYNLIDKKANVTGYAIDHNLYNQSNKLFEILTIKEAK